MINNQLKQTTKSNSHVIHTSNIIDMTRIYDPDTQMVLWHRELPKEALDYIASLSSANLMCSKQVLTEGTMPDLPSFPSGPGKEALVHDLRLMADILIELMDSDAIGFRTEIMKRAMCPNFHIDRVGIRLVTTFQGLGTEWLENEETMAAPLFSVALLKGSLWQRNEGKGIQHRSPMLSEGEPNRIVFVMDAL